EGKANPVSVRHLSPGRRETGIVLSLACPFFIFTAVSGQQSAGRRQVASSVFWLTADAVKKLTIRPLLSGLRTRRDPSLRKTLRPGGSGGAPGAAWPPRPTRERHATAPPIQARGTAASRRLPAPGPTVVAVLARRLARARRLPRRVGLRTATLAGRRL